MKTEIATLIEEYRNEFKGKIPRFTFGGDEADEAENQSYKQLVNSFHRRFGEHDIDRLRYAFEQHLLKSNGFFPKTTELFRYFGIDKDEYSDAPSLKQTAELIAERERMLEEAEKMNTKETQERMSKLHDELAKRLGIESEDSSVPNSKFRRIRVDFDSE